MNAGRPFSEPQFPKLQNGSNNVFVVRVVVRRK